MVPSGADCADNEGWHYNDAANPTRVVACPNTCARTQGAGSASIDLLFGCATEQLQLF